MFSIPHNVAKENSWYMSPREENQGSKLLRGLKRHHDDTETADEPKDHEDSAPREKVSQAEKKRRRSAAKEKRIAEEQLEVESIVSSARNRKQHASQSISRSSDDETGSPSQGMSQKLKAGLRLGPVCQTFTI